MLKGGDMSLKGMNQGIWFSRAFCWLAAAALVFSGGVIWAQSEGDGLSFSWDTTLSYGARWRVEDRDLRIIGVTNSVDGEPGQAWSVNSDDGNLNYDKGIVNNALKLTTEMEIRYRNVGGFFRASGFYDYENEKGDRARTPLHEDALERVGSRVDLLDAYVWGKFQMGDRAAELRLGNQVISWGESTFIQNSINAINPVDVGALRVPGAELREAYLPENLAWFSMATSESTELELLYIFGWNDVEIDPPGSYFSVQDFAGDGGPDTKVMLSFGRIPDYINPGDMAAAPVGGAVPKGDDMRPDETGQYGLAFRWYSPIFNDAEFGFYFLNYHSRLPIVNGHTGTIAGVQARDYAASAEYFFSYPEDIKLYGLSYNTSLGTTGIALQGEVSYRQDAPLQVDDVELLFASLSPLALLEDPQAPGVGTVLATQNQIGAFGFDETVPGYIRRDVTQFQTTATRAFSRALGADTAVVVFEGAVGYVHDMPDKDVLRLEAPGTFTSANDIFTMVGVQPATEDNVNFPDELAWGYRLAGRLEYNNALGPFNIWPKFSWQHDVSGISPGPGGNFLEGRKALTLGFTMDYLNTWSVEIVYTQYSGAGAHNLINDRDFIAFDTKYSF